MPKQDFRPKDETWLRWKTQRSKGGQSFAYWANRYSSKPVREARMAGSLSLGRAAALRRLTPLGRALVGRPGIVQQAFNLRNGGE